MISKIKKLSAKVGVDGAIAYTILSRIIQAGGGIISIVFIAKFLSGSEQGYYYTFASIIAIQIFFELGLSTIITQYTAHEFVNLQWSDDFTLIGEIHYKSRLSTLLRFCVKWFAIISIILFFVLIAAGFYFFGKFNKGDSINWKQPWIILCLATSLNLFIDPLLAFFDGLGKVKDMAKVRLLQKTSYIILLGVFFALGFKLYSSAFASIASIVINYLQIIFTDKIKFLKSIWEAKDKWVINYLTEIFPYQWRIAVSWISGYFIFQLFNPVLFATEGPIVAGQMGMTIAVLTGIASISMSWINTKVPLLSSLIAKKDYATLDEKFKTIFFQSIGINIICVIILVTFMQFAKELHLHVADRFLYFVPLLCMSLASIATQVIYALATYLRCHKKEPLLLQSITMGISVCISTIILGKIFGVIGIAMGYSILTCIFGLSWTYIIFIKKRKEWHDG